MDCSTPGSSVHGDSPSKSPGMGCHALLHWIFPTQGLNPDLPHCRQIVYCLRHQGLYSISLILSWLFGVRQELTILSSHQSLKSIMRDYRLKSHGILLKSLTWSFSVSGFCLCNGKILDIMCVWCVVCVCVCVCVCEREREITAVIFSDLEDLCISPIWPK